jgi:Flp pilus assembly protein TadB
MFWLVVAAVVVVLAALAWWSSGRARNRSSSVVSDRVAHSDRNFRDGGYTPGTGGGSSGF